MLVKIEGKATTAGDDLTYGIKFMVGRFKSQFVLMLHVVARYVDNIRI